jgi:hypothetical protein
MDRKMGNRLIRLGAIPATVAAILFVGFGVTPPLLLPVSEPLVEWVRDPSWFLLNVLALLMALLLPLALMAIYAAQAEFLGWIGFAGFVLAFLGSLLYLGLQFDESFVWPLLAAEAPSLLDLKGPLFSDAAFMASYLVMGLLFMSGWLVFGVATARAGIFPRLSGILLAVGMPVFGAGNFVSVVVRALGSVIAGIALLLLARSLWAWPLGTDVPADQGPGRTREPWSTSSTRASRVERSLQKDPRRKGIE